MSNIKESDFRTFAKELLFENQISERYMPDDFTNSKTTMFDRPGPQVNNSESELEYKSDIEIKIPLTADDFITNTGFSLKNKNVRDENYMPDNSDELGHAILSILDTQDKSDINKEVTHKIWKSITNILDRI